MLPTGGPEAPQLTESNRSLKLRPVFVADPSKVLPLIQSRQPSYAKMPNNKSKEIDNRPPLADKQLSSQRECCWYSSRDHVPHTPLKGHSIYENISGQLLF